MSTYKDKLAKQAGKALAQGEFFVAGAKYLPRGASNRRAAGGVFGAFGALAAGQTGNKQIVGGAPLPGNLALGLTNQRLLVFELNQATERVQALTHAIPVSHVLSVRTEGGRKVGFKVTYVNISLADGSELALEAVSPNAANGAEFARELETSSAPVFPPVPSPGDWGYSRS
ncbi:MAG TPA: hypothetical protein VME46_24665 [Acidimicrobiales bacterium]|nr:hypothetical protein [Acidimicrobiales bacterium]